MITGLYAGIFALILTVLIMRVAKRRWKYKVGLGDGGIRDLEQAIRVHGNFVETVPLLLILMFLLETNGTTDWVLHLYGIMMLIARCGHIWGVTNTPFFSRGRFAGTIATIFLYTVGALGMIFQFIL